MRRRTALVALIAGGACLVAVARLALAFASPPTTIQVVVEIPPAFGAPVAGYADTHTHQWSAEYAFGGAWIHGDASGPEEEALRPCDGGSLSTSDHAQTTLGALSNFVGRDSGHHPGRIFGYPIYGGWPGWDTISHQQIWAGWLENAHRDGLDVAVVSGVSFKPLCNLMPADNISAGSCEDMDLVELQIQRANEWAAATPWADIALTPGHARQIVADGKLAIVLAIEATDLFPEGDPIAQLDHFYGMGVRSIQLTHQLDNRFSGAAPHHFIFVVFQMIRNGRPADHFNPLFLPSLGFDIDLRGHNRKGLTDEGSALIEAMMDRNMLIDVAHLSYRATDQVFAIAKERNYYPIFVSHGHFQEIMDDEKQREEKTTPISVVDQICQTGGLFGLRTFPETTKGHPDSDVPNDCSGSSKSFAQAHWFGREVLGVDLAFATDMNGFAQQTVPRIGIQSGRGKKIDGCSSAKTKKQRKKQQFQQAYSGPQQTDPEFNRLGLGRIDRVVDLVAELQNFGVDTGNIASSGETLLRMWERSHEARVHAPVSRCTAAGFELGELTAATKKGCKNDKKDCKRTARRERKGCKKTCRQTKRSCTTSCRTIKGECKQSCRGTKASCKASCIASYTGKARRVCKRECRKAKRSCKKVCRADKRECKTDCRDAKRTCKTECVDTAAVRKRDCKEEFEACKTSLGL